MFILNRRALIAGIGALGGAGAVAFGMRRPDGAALARELYATPLEAPKRPMRVYHLGHSLVGRDMPTMLAQLAGHEFDVQLGWGTSLNQHLGGASEVNGFEATRPAHDAVQSGEYDALVLTEMVEIADAIRYHGSADALAEWAGLAQAANPDTRVYLYETWHHTDDPKGWLERIDADYEAFWKAQILFPALAEGHKIYVIPAGQAMAAVARMAENRGDLPGFADRHALFAKTPGGAQDTIHLSDLGAYVVAITHAAVLYHRTPFELRSQLHRADGTPSEGLLMPSVARAIQQTVWEVVRKLPETGIAQ